MMMGICYSCDTESFHDDYPRCIVCDEQHCPKCRYNATFCIDCHYEPIQKTERIDNNVLIMGQQLKELDGVPELVKFYCRLTLFAVVVACFALSIAVAAATATGWKQF